MPKKAELSVTEIQIKGRPFWRLTYPTANGRKREHFAEEKAANKRMKEIAAEARQFGERAEAMTSRLRADAVAAAAILDGTGASLAEAARHFRQDFDRRAAGISIADGVAKYLESRAERSADYLATTKSRLGLFRSFCEGRGRSTATLTAEDVSDFLSGLTVAPRTRGHFHKLAVSFCTILPTPGMDGGRHHGDGRTAQGPRCGG